jgi:hypothetical protein
LAASVTKCERGTGSDGRAEAIPARERDARQNQRFIVVILHPRQSRLLPRPGGTAPCKPAALPLLNLLAERPSREDINCGTRDNFAISSAFSTKNTMTDEDERELQTELARLQQEHRDLDAAIDALHQSPAPDLLRLQRLKKRKLQLRDRIAFIEDQITPDIIA